MPNKPAFTIALSVAGLVVASSVAVAMNLGIIDGTTADSPTVPATGTEIAAGAPLPTAGSSDGFTALPDDVEVVTVVVDDPGAAGAGGGVASPGTVSATEASARSTAATSTSADIATPTAEPTQYPVFPVAAAGEVALERTGDRIGFWGAYPTDAGWSFEVTRDDGHEVLVVFTNGNTKLRFHAELTNGVIETDVQRSTIAEPTTSAPIPVSSRHDDDHDDDDEDRGDHDDDDDEDRGDHDDDHEYEDGDHDHDHDDD